MAEGKSGDKSTYQIEVSAPAGTQVFSMETHIEVDETKRTGKKHNQCQSQFRTYGNDHRKWRSASVLISFDPRVL